jgi:ABC-type multidrug transport system fused ATPase/permease subunit
MPNPYLSLLQASWTYARRERKKFVLCYVIYLLANIVYAFNPLLLGWFVGSIQANGSRALYYTMLFAGAYIGLRLLELCFHVPGRIIERQLAFNIGKNYLLESYHQVLGFR